VPAFSSSSAGAAGNILLVEEYDALAVAIGCALRKFAPDCNTVVVGSLPDAQAAVESARPDLVLIDFDPPPPRAVAFLEGFRSTSPETRVLVIGPGLSPDLFPRSNKPRGLHFVNKPFDLAELGAAIQQLLQSPHRAGALRDLSLPDLLPVLGSSAATMLLQVEAGGRRTGEIHFTHGQVVHARAGAWTGLDALHEMMTWRATRFTEAATDPDVSRSIRAPWQTILRDALEEPTAAAPALATAGGVKRAAATSAGKPKKLVVIDDTEMLLLFVEEILSTADETLEITTAGTGCEGVERVSAVLPDLVLLDYSLPDITGDEVCRRLLTDEKMAHIPVVMMSGHVPELTATAARFENVVAAIAKPFLSHQLVDLVVKTLENSGPLESRRQTATPAAAPAPVPTPQPAPVAATEFSPPPSEVEPSASPPPLPFPTVLPPPIAQPPPAQPSRAAFTSTVVAAPSYQPSVAAERTIPPPSAPIAFPGPVAAVHIPATKSNSVRLSLPLEVVAMQFSPTLQMTAIRARPSSTIVSLHVEPGTLPGVTLPEAGFELGAVELDSRGQIEVVRLSPTKRPRPAIETRTAFPVAGLAVLPFHGGKAMQLLPSPTNSMTLQLEAPFELDGVELSASFGVRQLVLRARGGRMRVSMQSQNAGAGAAFDTAQVLLNRSGRIDEILLDAVALADRQQHVPQLAAMN